MRNIQFIQITPEQLQDAIIKGISSKLEDLKEHLEPKKPSEYLTTSDVCKLLSISKTSLWSYTKQKKLKSYSLKNKLYYKRTEVEAALIEMKPHSKTSSTNNKKSGSHE